MKKSTATALTATALSAALASTLAATPASAQNGLGEVITASSHGSSQPSAGDYRDPGDFTVPPQPALGSIYSGSAPLTIGLAIAATAALGQLLIDATPALRQSVDQLAAQAGLQWAPGSSEGNRIFDVPAAQAALQNTLQNAQLPGGIQLPQLPGAPAPQQ